MSEPAPVVLTFRDAIRRISPRWLTQGVAWRLLFTFGVHLDAVAAAVVDGTRRRWPGLDGTEDALGVIGQARKIRRGPAEPGATYAARLVRWLDDHRTRGNPYALLAQVGAFYAAAPFQIVLLYQTGARFTRTAAGVVSRQITAWAHDGGTAWARWWLYYDWPATVSDEGTWGSGGDWDSAGVWGSTLTPAEVVELRLVPNEWNAEHATGYVVLLSDGGETWGTPEGLWGDPGTWGAGGVAEIAVR